ncbi:prolyl oligopeptidase family serine peptidase [Streptomyces radiopugnans]|uniref:prolyl oligopeptidase family serine peptidase n=1 Tax=Streptomyces radiopugnans TaxID=403935 RepID=UPI003F1AA3FD
MTHLRHPEARRDELVEDIFGHRVADPYRWLEESGSPEVTAWSAAQRDLCRAALEALPGRRWLRDRMGELLAAGVTGPPVWRGEQRFFMRRRPGQEHAALHVVDAEGGERVLLDPTALDPTGRTTLDTWQLDREGRRLAFQTSTAGDDSGRLYVLDVASGDVIDGPVDRCRRSPVAWLPGGEAFFYVRRLPPEAVPPSEERYHRRVWLHHVGTDADRDDELVFGRNGPKTASYTVALSADGRRLIVSRAIGAARRNDLWIADLGVRGDRAPVFVPVQKDVDARTRAVVPRGGRVYLHTDHDAPRGRLAVVDVADFRAAGASSPSEWKDLLPEDPHAQLEHFTVLEGPELDRALLLAVRTRHTVSEITVHDLETGERLGEIATPGAGWVGEIRGREHEAWFTYTDPFTPVTVLRWDARTGTTDVPGSPPGRRTPAGDVGPASPTARTGHQITCASQDGAPVRVTVLAPSDRPSRPRPAILYVYGGFGLSYKPLYRPDVVAWVEAGGVYAVAHVRGGGEEGAHWHEAGIRAHKQKSIDDLHAAADALCRAGWTTPSQLVLSGESHGGLLVAAAVTQRPGSCRAALCAAPVLDLVRYERTGLGASWTREYGSAGVPEELGWLLRYSPYHNVREDGDYPAVFLTVSDGDGVVDPLHARKMCAALQHAAGPVPQRDGRGLTLLRVEPGVGHGPRATSRALELSVDQLSFAAWQSSLRLPR